MTQPTPTAQPRRQPCDTTALELLIDRDGLSDLLDQIAEICELKAEHLQVNWQDPRSARAWSSSASLINTATARIKAKGL